MNTPEFIVHVSVEFADSMVEEKLRYTTDTVRQTFTIGEAETLNKEGYAMLSVALASLSAFCKKQAGEEC